MSGETSAAPGRKGPAPSRGITATGPIAGLMPQRPTIWRAISVSCWMSDSAPVLVSPKTISSAARPAERDVDLRVHLGLAVVEAVALGRRERDAERHPARDDRDLAHRIGALGEHADDRMPALVVGGPAPVFGAHHHLPLGAEHDSLERVGEVGFVDDLVVPPRRQQRGLVDEIREIRADHARGRRRDPAEVDVGPERHATRVHLEDRLAAGTVGRLHRNPAVEAAGAKQRLVEDVGPVGRADHDHARWRSRTRPSR